jgi:hypothetical protein
MIRIAILFLIASSFAVSLADEYVLDDGTVFAGRTLHGSKDGIKKVETLTGIRSIPEARVEGYVPTREILPEYERLRSRFGVDQPRGLAVLTGWCREKGLYEEMFKLYDELLGMDPENADLHAFISEMATKIQYKAFDRQAVLDGAGGFALLKAMTRNGPTLRRIGATMLADLPEPARMAQLSKGMRSSDPKVRVAAIEVVTSITPYEALEGLVKAAIKDRDGKVRSAAVEALEAYEFDAILYPFLQALKSGNKTYRVNALEALADFQDIRSVGALISNLRPIPRGTGAARSHIYSGTITSTVTGFDTDVATGAAAASPKVSVIQDGALLDVGVLSIHTPRIGKKERLRIAEVLQSITGIDYGDDFHLWMAWWEAHRTELLKD